MAIYGYKVIIILDSRSLSKYLGWWKLLVLLLVLDRPYELDLLEKPDIFTERLGAIVDGGMYDLFNFGFFCVATKRAICDV